MTDLELERIGITKDGSDELRPNKYYCETTECTMTIFREATHLSVVAEIYQIGYVEGIKRGKARRSRELYDLILGRED